LILDASSVQRLGGQCLQVLLAAAKAWGLDGHSLSFASPSEAFVQALDLFGVAPDAVLHKEQCA
jgi:chemotaxis protein CheX